MTSTIPRGRLFVVEGPDGAGKTTLAKRIAEDIGGEYVKLPDRSTPTGKLIDSFLKGEAEFSPDPFDNECAAQMLFAANNLEKRVHLIDLLNSGKDVVLDRYLDSACVYHCEATNSRSEDFIFSLNTAMPIPDLVVVLELPWSVAEERRRQRGDVQKERNDFEHMHGAVERGFRKMEKITDWPRVFIDANQTPDAVLFQARKAVDDEKSNPNKPIEYVWKYLSLP